MFLSDLKKLLNGKALNSDLLVKIPMKSFKTSLYSPFYQTISGCIELNNC